MATQGQLEVLQSQWYDQPGGILTDPSALQMTIRQGDQSGSVVVGPLTISSLDHVAVGVYSYVWDVPVAQPIASYSVVWQATVNSLTQYFYYNFAVQQAPAVSEGHPGGGTWASLTDVVNITGLQATQQELTVAQIILEDYVHRVWRETDATRRDYIWLQRACAFQTLFVHDHPEILSMMDVLSISQEGMSVVLQARGVASEVDWYIAPLAKAAIMNLYRAANSTIRLNSAFQKNRMYQIGQGLSQITPWRNL